MSVKDSLTISPTLLESFPKQLLANWDRKVEIETAYITSVDSNRVGEEKRKGLKVRPRRFVHARLTAMDYREIAQLKAFQMRSANQVVPYPLYSDITQVTFASDTFTGDFTDTRFFVGARLIHFGLDAEGVRDVASYAILAVTDTTIQVASPIGAITGVDYVAPLIDADIELSPAVETVFTDNKAEIDVNVNEKMDESALIPSDLSSFSPDTYKEVPVFPFVHNWSTDLIVQITRFGTRIDFGRGRAVSVDSDRPQSSFTVKTLFDRSEAFEMLRWFDYCRGRLVPFWFVNPQNLWKIVSIGGSSITVDGQGLIPEDIELFFKYVKIVGFDGIMEVTDVQVSGNDLEIFSEEIPAGGSGDFLQPVHLMRFAKDSIREVWTNRRVCEMAFELVELLEPPEITPDSIWGGLAGDEETELVFGEFPGTLVDTIYWGGNPGG